MEKKAFFQLKEIINNKNTKKDEFGLNHSNKLTTKPTRYYISLKKALQQLSCLINNKGLRVLIQQRLICKLS